MSVSIEQAKAALTLLKKENMMRKVWIVVANSGLCKIFRAENRNTLHEFKTIEHLESHLKGCDLMSDKQGGSGARNYSGSDTFSTKAGPKTKEAFHFADEIAALLKEQYHKGEVDRIYLIAKAPFLGRLREAFNHDLSKMVITDIDKDLTSLKAEKIIEYLPPVL